MSKMGDLIQEIREKAGEDDVLFESLRWEINEFIQNRLEPSDLTYTAQEILEERKLVKYDEKGNLCRVD